MIISITHQTPIKHTSGMHQANYKVICKHWLWVWRCSTNNKTRKFFCVLRDQSKLIYQAWNKHASGMHQAHIKHASSMHQAHIKHTSSMHQAHIKHASSTHQACIKQITRSWHANIGIVYANTDLGYGVAKLWLLSFPFMFFLPKWKLNSAN